jgi:Arc/MetJ-type ribon-helix-helix transcriptional regulator
MNRRTRPSPTARHLSTLHAEERVEIDEYRRSAVETGRTAQQAVRTSTSRCSPQSGRAKRRGAAPAIGRILACMTIQVPVRLTDEDVALLDAAIARGSYGSRSEALRAGLERILREEREREIEEAYARGYGEHPQEEWVGQIGLAGLAAFDRAEGGPPL